MKKVGVFNIHEGNQELSADSIMEQFRKKAGAKIDAVISAKAAELGVSPYELLKTFRPKIESSIEDKGGERFYVTMKIGWELREP